MNSFLKNNFASREQMERLNKIYTFRGSFDVCKLPGQQQETDYFILPVLRPDALDEMAIEFVYNTADLTDILDELPQVAVARKNGELHNYYAEVDHYYHMVSFTNGDDENDVLCVFSGESLLSAAVDAIEWIQSNRKGGFVIELDDIESK